MTDNIIARQIKVAGQVQGVGFRPFIYRLARQHQLNGSVCNQMGQVEIIVQGGAHHVDQFSIALIERSPIIAEPHIVSDEKVPVDDRFQFEILPSETGGEASIHVPADFFTCSDCLAELHDPKDRRYAYPFINCTQCGPRYTLIEALPYDRPNTSMADFVLCENCEKEYTDPLNRRFHAEPIACPECGPRLRYESAARNPDGGQSPLAQAIQTLQLGKIVAVKGIGGYHLMCDARNERAVEQLRESKHRPDKPLAVMFSAAPFSEESDLKRAVSISDAEWDSLWQPARPIVLLRKQKHCDLAQSIAPGLNEIGVMLAYSPLHDVLLSEFGGPLVATSGNLSGEPVITSSSMAGKRLAGIAEAFLHHNRPIVRPADDSVLRFISGRSRTIRLGRGLAPLELELPFTLPKPVLALGGHMKATIALAWGRRLVVSPHIGEMESPRSLKVFEQLVGDLQALYGVTAKRYICDAHPTYASHRWARKQDLPVTTVWHHHGHASALAVESLPFLNDEAKPMLVFAWDGVGLGPDQTLWGGETLLGGPGRWQRYARWRPFNVPGGDLAGRAPWRSVAALCWELDLALPQIEAVSEDTIHLLRTAWEKKINAPQTTAVGRLFDGASTLLGLAEQVSFEGQGPMHLEALAEGGAGNAILTPIRELAQNEGLQIDWAPLIKHMLNSKLDSKQRAADWHESLAKAILKVAERARIEHEVEHIGLSGGVFQNRLLSERALGLLKKHEFICHFPERVPVNDGGLCVGQVVEYLYQVTG
jgi:hydrogenase maturation protein HypF